MFAAMSVHAVPLWQQFNARAEHERWPAICDPSLRFDAPVLVEILAKWRGATLGLPMPRRSALTTRVLGEHLKDVAIVDYIEPKAGPRRYRFRLQGRGLARMRGDFGGKFVDEVVPPKLAVTWTFAFDTVLQHGQPLRFVAHHTLFDRGPLTAETLAAPLSDPHGVPCSVLTAIAYSPVESVTHDRTGSEEAALAGL